MGDTILTVIAGAILGVAVTLIGLNVFGKAPREVRDGAFYSAAHLICSQKDRQNIDVCVANQKLLLREYHKVIK